MCALTKRRFSAYFEHAQLQHLALFAMPPPNPASLLYAHKTFIIQPLIFVDVCQAVTSLHCMLYEHT